MRQYITLRLFTCDRCGKVTTDAQEVENKWIFMEEDGKLTRDFCSKGCRIAYKEDQLYKEYVTPHGQL